jgi:transcriptional regulator with XRE-family HTH domain
LESSLQIHTNSYEQPNVILLLGQQSFMKRFGEKISQLRTQRGLTLTDLGDLLGVHNTFISQLEKGRKVPNAEMILKMADTFSVTTDQLMRDELDLPEDIG